MDHLSKFCPVKLLHYTVAGGFNGTINLGYLKTVHTPKIPPLPTPYKAGEELAQPVTGQQSLGAWGAFQRTITSQGRIAF